MATNLEGRTIVAFRPMTGRELLDESWDIPVHQAPPPVIELDDGTLIYPSRDEAGNGPGCFFGKDPHGRCVRFEVHDAEQPAVGGPDSRGPLGIG